MPLNQSSFEAVHGDSRTQKKWIELLLNNKQFEIVCHGPG